MNFAKVTLALVVAGLLSLPTFAQQAAAPSTPDSATTKVRGCLNRNRGNYLVVEDKTGLVYALRGVGTKLDAQVNHEVEVTGQLHPGSMKSGVRAEKSGSNPSDTVHGVEGVPLQIANVSTDVRMVAKKCTPAEEQ